ncbi:glycosyl hydrolase family 71 protein [Trichoderma pleuroticola]
MRLAAIALALLDLALQARAQQVFAHVIVGNTYAYSQGDWASDIRAAAAAGIDGFVLNIGFLDTVSGTRPVIPALNNAYNAADAAGFKLFISFDYLAQGPWDAPDVVNILNEFSSHPSQFRWANTGKPVASTFEGPGNAGDWVSIKQQTNTFFIPDYSSQGPFGAAAFQAVDGLFSFAAWPNGPNDMTISADQQYVQALNGKPYMMPVSPWFYTNLPAFNKNWLWRGDDLWHERWQQVLEINPPLVEILTWNDYGESHYVGPLPPAPIQSQSLPNGSWYVENIPHNAWLNDLPYYIAQYKKQPLPNENHVTIWYRLNPGTACSADGTPCNTVTQGQTQFSPQQCDVDAIYFTAFVPSSATATVHVTIGNNSPVSVTANAPGIFHSSVPFNGQTGGVSISVTASGGINIGPVQCPAITTNCNEGKVNWNAWVGGS